VNNLYQFQINSNPKHRVYVVDDFYQNPFAIRQFALSLEYFSDLSYFKGNRTVENYTIPGTQEKIEQLLNIKISNWVKHGMNGKFQYCTAEEQLVYHCDSQSWAGAVYLTPDAPYESGTSFWAGKNGVRDGRDDRINEGVFDGGFYDKSKFKRVDTIGNVFNRLVIWDGRLIHSASEYFGTKLEDSRLFHLFFFDVE
jgi:hypothetical protein